MRLNRRREKETKEWCGQQEQDNAAGLGCGTGELQRADLQEEKRRQQRADRQQREAAARADQQRQVEIMEDQMDELDLVVENSERTFQKTVQDVLNTYSWVNGKARSPGKDADMIPEIEMIRALTSKMEQGQYLRDKIGLTFTYGTVQLVVEPRNQNTIVLKNTIVLHMGQYTLVEKEKGVRVTMLSLIAAQGEEAPQDAIVDIHQPRVGLAKFLRDNEKMVIEGVRCDVSVRPDKRRWVHLRIDDARAADILHTIVAK